jgi:hypothetical protein
MRNEHRILPSSEMARNRFEGPAIDERTENRLKRYGVSTRSACRDSKV